MLSRTKRVNRSPLFAPTLMLLTCSALALSGCAALDLNVQAYPGARQPIGQVAKLRPLSVQILSVDGVPIKGKCGGQALRHCYVFLLPGSHSLRIQPMAAYGGGGPEYIAPTVATPGMYLTSSSGYTPVGDSVTVDWTFVADHSYTVIPSASCVRDPATKSAKIVQIGVCFVDDATSKPPSML